MEPTLPPVSIEPAFANTLYDLILNADPVVKGVMLLLAFASVLCWAIILEKGLRLMAFRGQLGRLERFAETFSAAPAPQAWLASALLSAAYRLDLSPQESRIDREA